MTTAALICTIQQYEDTFPSKMECASFLKISWEQLRRYRKMGAIVIKDKVYTPAIKRQVTLERQAQWASWAS